jgi:pentapeptide MXKDX repeat protein
MNWKLIGSLATFTLMASIAACSSTPEANQQSAPSVAPSVPAASTSPSSGAMKDDAMKKDGDAMKNDAMKGDAMKKDDGAMKGDAMKKDDGAMKKDTPTKP